MWTKISEKIENANRVYFLKLGLILLTAVLMVSALLFIYVGFTEWIEYSNGFMNDIFFTVPISCIVIGFLTIIAFSVGMIGIVKEQIPCLVIYSTLLSVCSLMEFGTCFMVQDFKEMNIYGKIAIDQSFSNLIEMYDPTTGVETLDILQPMLKCCGVKGYEDWSYEHIPQRLIDLGYWANPLYPHSCCEYDHDVFESQFCVASASNNHRIHPIGCRSAFIMDLQDKAAAYSEFVVAMGCLKILSLLIGIWLSIEIKMRKNHEEAFQIYCRTYSKQQKITSISFEE